MAGCPGFPDVLERSRARASLPATSTPAEALSTRGKTVKRQRLRRNVQVMLRSPAAMRN
jgi:hypothetical protein